MAERTSPGARLCLQAILRDAVRLACFEAALRYAAGEHERANALSALVGRMIERGTTGTHGAA